MGHMVVSEVPHFPNECYDQIRFLSGKNQSENIFYLDNIKAVLIIRVCSVYRDVVINYSYGLSSSVKHESAPSR